MDNRSVIVGKRWDGKLVFLSDPNESIAETESNFMPFRLTAGKECEFEEVAIYSLSTPDRNERFSKPTVAPQSNSKKSK